MARKITQESPGYTPQTKGKAYNQCVSEYQAGRMGSMGYMSSYVYWNDPLRVVVSASRYKFVAKMMNGLDRVLELGCSDAFYSQIVAQRVGSLVASDYDEVFIEQAKKLGRAQNMELKVLDLTKEPCENEFDGIYALDVLEHIAPEDEDKFMQNIVRALKKPVLDSQYPATSVPMTESMQSTYITGGGGHSSVWYA